MTYTPMIQQYLSVKSEVPDAFLFFRLGDFYEMFFDDAILAAKELEITLTGREGGTPERIPMCGVPHHAAEGYIARLIEKGYKVAICEQVEDPASSKGVVRREIVRIVTPGTLMEGKLLSETTNNYVACVASERIGATLQYGFAVCDLSTGELHATSVEAMPRLLVDELYVFSPSELIGDENLLIELKDMLPSLGTGPVSSTWTKQSQTTLLERFPNASKAQLDAATEKTILLLLGYLEETQKRSLSHLTDINFYEPSHYMMMDPFTRRNLELTETVRDRSKKGSLLWLLDSCVTAMGGRMLRKWLEKPLMNVEQIEERLEAVDCLYRQLIVRDDLRLILREVYDLERLVGRIAFGNANARDLRALMVSLQQLPGFRELCHLSGSTKLAALIEGMDDCGDIASRISSAIVDEPPVSVQAGGLIRTGYDAYLDQLREADRNGKRWLAELEQKEREATGIKSLKIGFNKVFGYYIEITRANVGQLPEGRYERKQTLANAERFVTPELKEKESLILEAQEKMIGIEYDIFTELREHIASQVHRLQKLADIVATADVLQSLAHVSAKQRYKRPTLSSNSERPLSIVKGRHPVVEAVMQDGKFIDNDTMMSVEDGKVMLITGPNMAGKSTYMRQVAMICIMAQIGCFVPADQANIPIIDRIFTRIGAADDLIGGQSTFMVEMMDIQVMTEKATANSLVIIDELGRGTSTGEGMAIAQSVIEYMHDRIGCKTLVSTHFHELAHLEDSLFNLRNYRMAVKESGRQVTFLRKLVRGAADSSYGIYCAQIAGLPQSIIDRSYALLHSFEEEATTQMNKSQPSQAVQLRLSLDEFPTHVVESKVDPKVEQVFTKIRTADLMNMTPLQAMQLIDELKKFL
jgi:DNA mismatch repair protein MutS